MDKSKTYIVEWNEKTDCWVARSDDFREESFMSEKYVKPDCKILVPLAALADCIGLDGIAFLGMCNAYDDGS